MLVVEPQLFGMPAGVWQQLISILVLMILLIPSAIGDYQRQKVPNWLSMSGWVLGPLIAWSCTGLNGMFDAFLGLGFMAAIFLPLWFINWFGAADVKLIGSVGALTGVSDAPAMLLGVMLAGLLMAITMLFYKRAFYPLWRSMIISRGKEQGSDKAGASDFKKASERVVVPYAVPIAFGTMLTTLYLLL